MGWKSALAKSVAPLQEFSRPTILPMKIDLNKVVTVDFETYFDADYTLKKLSTSEYVRDPRFKIQMVGIKIGKRKTKTYNAAAGRKVLQDIDWSTYSLLCHHTHFDGFIMSHHMGIVPHFYLDTLSMARGLHSNEVEGDLDSVAKFYGGQGKIEGFLEKTKGIFEWPKALFNEGAVYCAQDIDETFRIFCEMVVKMPAEEMELIDLIVRMFCDPVLRVDIPRVEAEHAREVERREKLFFTAINPVDYDIGGKRYDANFHKKSLIKGPAERALEGVERLTLIAKRLLGNNEFYADLLRAEGIEPPVKISPAWMKKSAAERDDEDKWTYAFAKTDLDFVNLPDDIDAWRGKLNPNKRIDVPKIAAKQERIQTLIDARLATKSTGNITRAARFLEAGRDGMCLPVGYAYYRAHTGRLGGSNKMNMQNLARRGELRLSILAPEGYELCVADSSQIEARMNAWLWGQDDLLEAFRLSRDVYCEFATDVYGRPITKADVTERHVGKTAILGLGYQMGAPKLQLTLARGQGGVPVYLTLDECYRIVNTYRSKMFRIRDGWARCNDIIADMAAGRQGSYKCLSWEKETLWLPNGMSLKYPDLRQHINEKGYEEWTYQAADHRSKIYGGLLCENIIQALARIVVMSQMLVINRKYRCVMTTHDEVAALAKKAQAERCVEFMVKTMSKPLSWCPDIPITAEGVHAPNYAK